MTVAATEILQPKCAGVIKSGMSEGPKARQCNSPGKARNERSPGFGWMRDAALKGRHDRTLPVL